jgi:hypothetical protein
MHFGEERVCNCGKKYREVLDNAGRLIHRECDDCLNKRKNEAREKWLSNWRGDLTQKQRIEKIENWIYKQENKKR